ncbi:helix-turn-helix transcriptional regulator [Microbacterium sp. 1P10UB]|uniref:hypothetical protein n=1 Tax=unclassified Microbacterium TaxID=2609290 RepID=UPI0039A03B82
MPKYVQPAGSDDAHEPIALLGNLVKTSILRYLRANPGSLIGPICTTLELGTSTVVPHLNELVRAGLVLADPPMTEGETRRGVWVRYTVNNEVVTELYLRLGLALGEF